MEQRWYMSPTPTGLKKKKKRNVRNDIGTYAGQYRKGLVYIERIARESGQVACISFIDPQGESMHFDPGTPIVLIQCS